MPKKHRVKRQNYVAHLLTLEKKREEYLEKRRVPKRSREVRNNEEEVTGAGRDAMESTSLKKRRTEAAEVVRAQNEEEHHEAPRKQRPAPSDAESGKRTLAAASSVGAAMTDGEEKKAFFANAPFSELLKSAPLAKGTTVTAAAKSAPAKKTLARRY